MLNRITCLFATDSINHIRRNFLKQSMQAPKKDFSFFLRCTY